MDADSFESRVNAVASVLGAAAPLATPVPPLAGALLLAPVVAKFIIAAHAAILKAKPPGMADAVWLSHLADPTLATDPEAMYQQAVQRLADAQHRAQ